MQGLAHRGISLSYIANGTEISLTPDDTLFPGESWYRAVLDFPAASGGWDGFKITLPPLSTGRGSAVIQFNILYRWRKALEDEWQVETPYGLRQIGQAQIARLAAYHRMTFEDYVTQKHIDLKNPDRPARAGSGQPFYVELMADSTLIDACSLDESEPLPFKDDECLGFYGKKTVKLYVKDVQAVEGAKLAVHVYIGEPGSCYSGSIWLGPCSVTAVNAEALPSLLINESMSPPRPLSVGAVTVSPVDAALIPEAVAALAYLKGAAEAGRILYGVQNYPYEKGGKHYRGASMQSADIFDLTGANPAVFGFDSLSLIGMENAFRMPEIKLPGEAEADPVNIPLFIKGSALRSLEAWKNGSIPTLSLHMSDPAMVYDQYAQDNVNPVTGRAIYHPDQPYPWNFYGYGYGNSTRTTLDPRDGRERSVYKPMLRLFRALTEATPDKRDAGVLKVYNAYLDIAADYCLMLQEQGVPVLFRPLHENSGDWFWWGNSGCENEDNSYNPEIFKQVWRHTVTYLYGRNVHNCIYVYSPNGTDFDNEEKINTRAFRPYAITYPGDEWVDVCAFDDYTSDEQEMRNDVTYVTRFAAEHGKIAAASEVTGSPVKPEVMAFLFETLTDTKHLPVNLSYFLQWTPPSFGPYLTSPTRANSNAANTVIRILGNEKIIMSNETNGFKVESVYSQ